MHWFWRAAIAVIVGSVTEFLAFVFMSTFKPQSQGESLAVLPLLFVAPMVTVGVYAKLSRRKEVAEQQTRYRKCGYILRGLSEPKCPECGERI